MQFILNLLINGAVWGLMVAIIALAIVAIYLVARFPQAATGDFTTAGSYVAYITYTKVSPSVVVAGLAAASAVSALALLYFVLVFKRLRGRSYVSALLASIGVAFFTRYMMTFFVGFDPIVLPAPLFPPIRIGGVSIQIIDLAVAATALALFAVLSFLVQTTDIGRDMRAVSDDPDLAKVSGIKSQRILMVVWPVVGAICGIGGFLLAVRTVVDPDTGWNLLLAGFAGAILGGLTSFRGALLGSMMIGISQELSAPILGGSYKFMVPFIIILLTLLIKPSGLFGRHLQVR